MRFRICDVVRNLSRSCDWYRIQILGWASEAGYKRVKSAAQALSGF